MGEESENVPEDTYIIRMFETGDNCYFLVNGTCKKYNIAHCLDADASGDPNICSVCQNNFELINGSCILNDGKWSTKVNIIEALNSKGAK